LFVFFDCQWPTPTKVFQTLITVWAIMIGAAAVVYGLDYFFYNLGVSIGFVYGENPFYKGLY
jgi:hypothetical protein